MSAPLVHAVRLAGGRISVRYRTRSLVVCGIATLATAVLLVVSLASGSYPVSVRAAIGVLLGGGEYGEQVAVLTWRLPRALMAVVAGAALALSGAVFQSLTRNPLGSPDVIGFSSGAYAGAVFSILVWQGEGPGAPIAALAGGLVAAAVVYLLAMKRTVEGFRLIIVGIAVGEVLNGITSWLILHAETDAALAATVWASGSLADVTWPQLYTTGYAVLGLSVLLATQHSALAAIALGDDTARALGTNIGRSMLVLSLLGVALTAVVTAYCGLITFVALAAPQIARRLVRTAEIPLVTSALVGALLLLASDWIAQHGLGQNGLPVGVVTISIGGLYLVHLLVQEARRR